MTGGQFDHSGEEDLFYNPNQAGGHTELMNRLFITGGRFKKDVSLFLKPEYACIKGQDDEAYPYEVVASSGSGPVFTLDGAGKPHTEAWLRRLRPIQGERFIWEQTSPLARKKSGASP